MQHSVNVTMEKRLALEVNTNKQAITIPRFSTFANHLSSMISCPDFTDRGAWSQKVTEKGVGVGGTVSRGAVSDAGYRMDDNFKLAFLLNDSY
uniref:Uncharacterized protein n=2 Tax=Parascaris TaxID=6254 RepID=A0A915AF28_PARUN